MNTPIRTPAFRPGGARYLVLPDTVETKSETIGDQVISERPDPHKQASSGTIVARGKSCTDYEVGDWISYGMFSGYDQEVDREKFKVLQEAEILGERLRTPFDNPSRVMALIEGLPDPTGASPMAIYEVPVPAEHPRDTPQEVCNYCFRSDGTEHYGWCPTLLPVETEPKMPAPKPTPTLGICSSCGDKATSETATICLDCLTAF